MTTATPTDGDDERPPRCVQQPPNGHHLTFVTSHQHLGKEGMAGTEEQGYGDGWGVATWVMVRVRDASRALGKFYIYIFFKLS